MKVKALRGVCVGVDQHLKAGDTADLERSLVTFLTGIGAVELVPDEPATPDPEPTPEPDPDPKSKAGKSGAKEK